MIYAKSSVVTFWFKTINGTKQRDFVFPPEGAGAYTKRGVFPCPQRGFTGIFFLVTEISEFKEFLNSFSTDYLSLNFSITNKDSEICFLYPNIITDYSSL